MAAITETCSILFRREQLGMETHHAFHFFLDGPDGPGNRLVGTGPDSDEIDWDKVGSNLWGDEEGDFTLVEKKNDQKGALRRSSRNLGHNMKVQEKAETSKKRYNEISGKPSPFAILSIIDQHILESLPWLATLG
jgi:hypothetical protein